MSALNNYLFYHLILPTKHFLPIFKKLLRSFGMSGKIDHYDREKDEEKTERERGNHEEIRLVIDLRFTARLEVRSSVSV